MTLKTVRVPAGLEPVFRQAEETVARFFSETVFDPSRGTIEIFGERYVLVRAASLSVEFFALVRELYGAGRESEADTFARNILFDLAHAVGKSDAHDLHAKMKLTNPIARLSLGPPHFAHTGWAFVDIFPESKPATDDSFFLVFEHPYSFESSAWIEKGKPRDFPVCIMSAGYASGWCEASFGIELVASEILCRANGDDSCRFVMAHPTRIQDRVTRYVEGLADQGPSPRSYEVPDFFARKRIEEELRRSHAELERRVEERTAELRESYRRLEREIEERERVEKQLRQAHKLEAIGRLSGGIAHDFNNLMALVMLRASWLEQQLAESPLLGEVSQIHEAARQAAALTQKLLAFSRSQVVARERLDLTAVVTELAETLMPLIGEHIELDVSLESDAGAIEIDRGQIEQIIMNLVVNARDAMPSGGSLQIRTRHADLERPVLLTTGELARGRYAVVSVSDTGSGMNDDVLSKIFDPFFTTKPEGLGTGLGLSTVYGAVVSGGGGIDVKTALGKGSRFDLYFVRVEGSKKSASAPAPDDSRGQGERVLLVEDQADLRDSLEQLLVHRGYTVFTAAGPSEALELAKKHGSEIALLLTDVVMPKMNGDELARAVRAIIPDLRVIFMSGYTPDEGVQREVAQKRARFLQKPFSLEQLARRVREALQSETKESV